VTGLSLASRLVATRLGLGTASLFGVFASHRSGVRVPTPLRGFCDMKTAAKMQPFSIKRE
jgi:hypothetical protein